MFEWKERWFVVTQVLRVEILKAKWRKTFEFYTGPTIFQPNKILVNNKNIKSVKVCIKKVDKKKV